MWSLALIFILYALLVGTDLIFNINCWSSGLDFCAYWSSGKAALENGVQGVYDTNILVKYQENLFPDKFEVGAPYEYVPFPYPPIFVIPFELFAMLPLQISYLLWTGLKLFCFAFYLWFFYRSVSPSNFPWKAFILIMFSAPLFNELRFGQMNLWLAILVGEFARNMIKDRKLIAGLILSLVLIKFQILVLIVPFLLIRREIKALIGFGIGGFIVALSSLAVAGVNGMQGFFTVLTNSMQGHSAANVQRMSNWRMIGETIDSYLGGTFGIYVVIVGALVTLYFLYKGIDRNKLKGSDNEVTMYGLLFLGTTIVTWHSHVEMNMIFAPFLLVAIARGWMQRNTFALWFVLGVAAFVIIPMAGAVISYVFQIKYDLKTILIPLQVVYFGLNLRFFYEWVLAARSERMETIRV